MNDSGFRYYLITDRKQCTKRTLTEAVEEACSNGVRAIQLREKDLRGRELYDLAYKIRVITSRWNAMLFINDRADVAMAVGADGVHCPEAGMSPGDIHKLNDGLLAGVSVHSVDAAKRAEKEGADFLLFGPVYHTPSKAKYGESQGLFRLKEVVRAVHIPVYAVGGINPVRVRSCRAAGAYGVAGISSIMQADSIEHKVNEWKERLERL